MKLGRNGQMFVKLGRNARIVVKRGRIGRMLTKVSWRIKFSSFQVFSSSSTFRYRL